MDAALHEDDEVLEKNHNTDQYDEYMKLVKAKRRGQLVGGGAFVGDNG